MPSQHSQPCQLVQLPQLYWNRPSDLITIQPTAATEATQEGVQHMPYSMMMCAYVIWHDMRWREGGEWMNSMHAMVRSDNTNQPATQNAQPQALIHACMHAKGLQAMT